MGTRLLLARHGQTEWHAENRYAGRTDVALTAVGRRQAEELGDWARRRGVDAVACSPLGRARQTARPAAAALGLTPQVVDGLREVDFGWAEGRTIGELAAEDAAAVAAFREDAEAGAFPGSEPPSVAGARARDALRALAAAHPGGSVLVVAHNTVLRAALCLLLGLPVGRYRRLFPRLENAAITEIAVSGAETALHTLNLPTQPTQLAHSDRSDRSAHSARSAEPTPPDGPGGAGARGESA